MESHDSSLLASTGSSSRSRASGNNSRGSQGSRFKGRGFQPRGGPISWRGSTRGSTLAQASQPLGTQPMRDLLSTITLEKVQSLYNDKEEVPMIKNCQYVASYNWLSPDTPTILVPGAPPLWSPPTVAPALKQDRGEYFRDPNAARWPKFPTEPAIRAVFTLNPKFDGKEIDVVGCGNTIGNLLRFAEASDRTFQFNIEVIGETLFLVRKGKSPTELIPDVYGYGHTYPEAYTRWDNGLNGSTSHQRLIKYDFGGIRCLLRFESDGYIKEKSVLENQSRARTTTLSVPHSTDDNPMSSLQEAASSLFVVEKLSSKSSKLTIQHSGHPVSQTAIFDLKTRSARSGIKMEEIYPRLWVAQIPKLIVAYHQAGKFDPATPKDLSAELEDWQTTNSALIRALHATLRLLMALARQFEDQKLEVHRFGTGPLKVRKVGDERWTALPRDLRARWGGNGDWEEEVSDDEDEYEDADDYLKF